MEWKMGNWELVKIMTNCSTKKINYRLQNLPITSICRVRSAHLTAIC